MPLECSSNAATAKFLIESLLNAVVYSLNFRMGDANTKISSHQYYNQYAANTHTGLHTCQASHVESTYLQDETNHEKIASLTNDRPAPAALSYKPPVVQAPTL